MAEDYSNIKGSGYEETEILIGGRLIEAKNKKKHAFDVIRCADEDIMQKRFS